MCFVFVWVGVYCGVYDRWNVTALLFCVAGISEKRVIQESHRYVHVSHPLEVASTKITTKGLIKAQTLASIAWSEPCRMSCSSCAHPVAPAARRANPSFTSIVQCVCAAEVAHSLSLAVEGFRYVIRAFELRVCRRRVVSARALRKFNGLRVPFSYQTW